MRWRSCSAASRCCSRARLRSRAFLVGEWTPLNNSSCLRNFLLNSTSSLSCCKARSSHGKYRRASTSRDLRVWAIAWSSCLYEWISCSCSRVFLYSCNNSFPTNESMGLTAFCCCCCKPCFSFESLETTLSKLCCCVATWFTSSNSELAARVARFLGLAFGEDSSALLRFLVTAVAAARSKSTSILSNFLLAFPKRSSSSSSSSSLWSLSLSSSRDG
mmetsp:Transcript_13970/g.28848  ORF Transcript_13970/g.28848 Transcript_13970/m.28848 type:complete len:217 (+) Transcript_13970:2144-2794(+)